MREIKFRAWNPEAEAFATLEFEERGNLKYCPATLKDEPEVIVDGYGLKDWQQYTGLKDKNGKEIYEGDIVKYTAEVDEGQIDVVKFETEDIGSCGCCWEGFSGSGFKAGWLYLANSEYIEVIGNIYESKGLLEKGEDNVPNP